MVSMRLGAPKDFTDPESGDYKQGKGVHWFPWICPHCSRCYWYRAADLMRDAEGQVDDACYAALNEEVEAGRKNPGMAFWQALLEDVRERKKADADN